MVTNTQIPTGYKQTEAGVIPQDWEVKTLDKIISFTNGKAHEQHISENGKYLVINSKFISTEGGVKKYSDVCLQPVYKNDIAMVMSDVPNGKAIAKCFYVDKNDSYALNQRICSLRALSDDPKYLFFQIDRNPYYLSFDDGVKQTNLRKEDVLGCPILIPSDVKEQQTIARTILDVNTLITKLDELIEKKRNIKQGAMQGLLTGKLRLPGFSGEWEEKTIEEVADCLDNLRVPLNDSQRSKMRGDIPYCGANGVLDYVNDYVVNDDIILIAEDGGYFDEYAYRPIAYRMKGKCWVNNHAHILKAKEHVDQGFLYYSLVHKNILRFLASGTRAKLNKSEMYKIEVTVPTNKDEQSAIAEVLNEMDQEIEMLEKQRSKYADVKQGMMQQLLTGKIRLV